MAPSGPPAAKAKAEAPKPKAKPKAEKKPKEEGAEPEADKVPPPDRAAFEETMNKIQEAIDGFQKKQAAITVKIQARSGGKEEFFAQKAALRGQLDEFAGKIDTLMEKRNGINAQIGAKRAETQDAKQALGKMKKELGFKSESEIDDRIASIEFKMWTESVSLKDEKKYLQEISQLKRNRPKVSQVNRKEAELGAMAANPAQPLREQIPEINAEISALRDGKRQIQEKMSELMEQRKAQLGDLPEIIDQRDAIGKQIQGKIKERNEARDEYRKKEREYRKYQDVLRAERQKKFVEEREAKNKEYDIVRRQRAAEKLDDQPHVAEMTLIEQSMAFCKSLTAVKEEKKEEEKKDTTYDVPDGAEIMLKKEDRDEFWFAPLKAKGKKGKTAKKESGSAKPIKHNAETFKLFDQLKLDAPITTDDIPALMEKLEAKYEDYKKKVAVWEQKREEMKKQILEGKPEEEEKAEEKAEEKKEEES